MRIRETGAAEGGKETRTQRKSAVKKFQSADFHSNLLTQMMVPSTSGASSPCKSGNQQETSSAVPLSAAKPKEKQVPENPTEQTYSSPGVESRSRSNPKERASSQDKPAKKRLSLPSNANSGPQTARTPTSTSAKRMTNNSQKTMKDRFKFSGDLSKSVNQAIDS
ncbi:hypothetical protein Dimus_020061 [Dionaea muscipula]